MSNHWLRLKFSLISNKNVIILWLTFCGFVVSFGRNYSFNPNNRGIFVKFNCRMSRTKKG